MTDFSLFLGRFHPLAVHLPIGIILLAALLEFLSFSQRFRRLRQMVPTVLLIGAISAFVTAFLGYLLSQSGGYDSTTLFWHQWLGISTGVLALIAWLAMRFSKPGSSLDKLHIVPYVLGILVVLVTITGHLGGNLAWGSGYLVEYMPAPMKKLLNIKTTAVVDTLPANLDSVMVFGQIIRPVLEKKCISCHNNDSQHGGLDLMVQDSILKGGKEGPAVIPGDPGKSELLRRIKLPLESKKHMPPNGKTPISPVESAIIEWWIQSGAGFNKNLAHTQPDDKMRFLLGTYLGISPDDQLTIVLPKVAPADSSVLKTLNAKNVFIRKISENSNLLDVSFTMSKNTDGPTRQAQFELLGKIKDQVLWLNLSSCGLTDTELQQFSEFPNLQRLWLERNDITDVGIKTLEQLPKLEYLNIYQNPITDKSIPVFEKMTELKKLYAWGTALSADGITQLKSSRPGMEVVQ